MTTVKFLVDIVAASAALLAAWFWWRASIIRMPPGPIQFVHPHFENAVIQMVQSQGRRNAIAATWSAVAAGLTGFSVLLAKLL